MTAFRPFVFARHSSYAKTPTQMFFEPRIRDYDLCRSVASPNVPRQCIGAECIASLFGINAVFRDLTTTESGVCKYFRAAFVLVSTL